MKKILVIVLTIGLIYQSCKNNNEDYRGLYSSIFVYEKIDSCKYGCSEILQDTTSTYKDFYNQYQALFSWAYLHYFFKPNQSKIDSICIANYCDSIKINIAVTDLLLKDKLFNNFFIPFYERYRNHSEIDKKYEISIDSLQTLTAYFYSAKRWSRDGSIQTSVCGVRNPFQNMVGITPIMLEIGGFCFLTVHNDLMNNEFVKYTDIIGKEIKELKLSDDELINVMSKRIYSFMKNSDIVKNVIIETYKKNKQVLGFKIKE